MGINEIFFIDNQIIFKKNFVDQCASFIESGFGGWTRELLLCSYEVVCSLSKLGSVLSGFGKRLLRVTCAITFVLNNIRLLIFCYYFTLPISISILLFFSSFTFLKMSADSTEEKNCFVDLASSEFYYMHLFIINAACTR